MLVPKDGAGVAEQATALYRQAQVRIKEVESENGKLRQEKLGLEEEIARLKSEVHGLKTKVGRLEKADQKAV